jgi:hypothetical protein
MHQLFERQVAIRPDAPAVSHRGQSLTVEAWTEINFDDNDIEVLGMPADSDWAFYAPNYFDPPKRLVWAMTLLLLATTVVTLAWSWDWRRALACYVIAAVLGPCGEMMAVHHGAWSYPDPTCFGIPVYLPFGWGLMVVVIIWMSESVVARPIGARCASNGGTESQR